MTHKNKIFGCLSMTALLFAGSCADNATISEPSQSDLEGKRVVTLSVSPQGTMASSRAGGNALGQSSLSTASKIDKLVYSVYEKNANGEYEIVTDYLNETTGGVNVIDNASFPLTLQFVMDPEQEFAVAFWAQSSLCDAYTTTDLTRVKVDYSGAGNNDELRDAFCNTGIVKGNQTETQQIILRRPFAQINVGDPGWDYEAAALMRPNPRTYATSSIILKGLAQFYNVLEGRTVTQSELDADGKNEKALVEGGVTFSLASMPAFYNLSTAQWADLDYRPYSEKFGPKDEVEGDDDEVTLVPRYDSEIEEFLYLALNKSADGDYGYGSEYQYNDYIGYDTSKTLDKNLDQDLKSTERYKYLSMSYILVPVTKDAAGKVSGAVLDEVTFWAADAQGNNSKKLFSIDNVPVQQNWRTNIISNRMFMAAERFKLFIVPVYAGDFVNESGNNTGDSYQDWNDVTMGNDKVDSDGNNYWYVKDNNAEKNPEFPGYGDQKGEYDDWDKEHDKSQNAE